MVKVPVIGYHCKSCGGVATTIKRSVVTVAVDEYEFNPKDGSHRLISFMPETTEKGAGWHCTLCGKTLDPEDSLVELMYQNLQRTKDYKNCQFPTFHTAEEPEYICAICNKIEVNCNDNEEIETVGLVCPDCFDTYGHRSLKSKL